MDFLGSLYRNKCQLPNEKETKRNLVQKLTSALQVDFNDCKVVIFGSTITGLATRGSDLDIMLKLHGGMQLYSAALILQKAALLLQTEGSQTIKAIITDCKVPIIRGMDRESGISWDLSMYRESTIKVAHLIKNYVELDERVPLLIMAVKLWAKKNNVYDAHLGLLSSYSWTLMVINYLQCGCLPPVLPCLQQDYSNLFGDAVVPSDPEKKETTVKFSSRNTLTADELFIGFFSYHYQTFRYMSDVVSVRTGKLLQKSAVVWRAPRAQWQFYCIEEPYELFNTARSMFKYEPYQRVFSRIRYACQCMNDSSIQSVLPLDL